MTRKYWTALVAVALVATVAAVSAFVAPLGNASAPSRGISSTERAALLSRALETAKINGDPHPFDIQAVHTTYGRLSRVVLENEGGERPAREPVFVLAMRGHFACGVCSRPPDAKEPKGAVIFLAGPAPPREHGWSLFNLGRRYPNLRKLGAPVRLHT